MGREVAAKAPTEQTGLFGIVKIPPAQKNEGENNFEFKNQG